MSVVLRTMKLQKNDFYFYPQAFGHERVAVLDGGLKKWEAEGLETETGAAATPEVS